MREKADYPNEAPWIKDICRRFFGSNRTNCLRLSAALTPWDAAQSPLYRHIPAQENKEDVGKRILSVLLCEIEKNPQYAFLHSNTEFQQMLKRYQAKC
jgi:hypothetical protein